MKTKMMYAWLLVVAVMAGCGGKELTNEEKIAGTEEKTWKAKRETTSSGSVDPLTRDEKQETVTFWKNGNVKMSNGTETMSGQWSLEANTLKMKFTGSEVSENFDVMELEKDNMKLKAGDGSVLTMKPD